MSVTHLTHGDIERLAARAAQSIRDYTPALRIAAYAVPRGGVPAAYAIKSALAEVGVDLELVQSPEEAAIFIDDLIDSGDTMNGYCDRYPGRPFYSLIDKTCEDHAHWRHWIVFPWEGGEATSLEDNIVRLLQFIGEDPKREGLQETPQRVAKAWRHWCSGYGKNPADILKVFEDGAEKHNQMVTVVDIPFYSHCEHHLAPIFGTATVSYIPNGKIVGLSKLSRLVDMYARRLQVQERLTDQIADALMDNLQPLGVGVVIKARHLCMESRGICQQGHYTMTTALRGSMMEEASTRAEFLQLAR